LARAYVLRGDTAKAKAAYQEFLTLWKDVGNQWRKGQRPFLTSTFDPYATRYKR